MLRDNYRDGTGWEVSGEIRREGTYLYLIHGFMWMPGRGQHNVAKQLPSNPKKKKRNNCSLGTSLVVPWLRLPAFTVGDTISIPGQGTK